MQDSQENSMNLGNEHFGPTGANNDASIGTSGSSLESLVLNAPSSFSGGVPDMGQQSPRDGKSDLGV